MVTPSYDMPGRTGELAPDEGHGWDYDVKQHTGKTSQNIVVDKRQYVSNYININVTGEGTSSIDTLIPEKHTTYTYEAEVCAEIEQEIETMANNLEDPCDFEQRLVNVINLLDKLNTRIEKREAGFSDLHALLKLGLINLEYHETTIKGINVVRESIKCLKHRVTQKVLAGLRQRLRENGIDVLKPFKSEIDVQQLLRDLISNETATGYNNTDSSESTSST